MIKRSVGSFDDEIPILNPIDLEQQLYDMKTLT